MAQPGADRVALQSRLEETYKEQHGPAAGAPPSGPTIPAAAQAEIAAVRAALAEHRGDPGPLQAELERLYREAYDPVHDATQGAEGRAANAADAPSPTTLTFAAETEESVKAAFAAVAWQEGATREEAQAVLDQVKGARPMTPAACHAELATAWGAELELNLQRADRAFARLPFRLQAAINALEDYGERPSPLIAQALAVWEQRAPRGVRMR
jgi:hypothetical protein